MVAPGQVAMRARGSRLKAGEEELLQTGLHEVTLRKYRRAERVVPEEQRQAVEVERKAPPRQGAADRPKTSAEAAEAAHHQT